MNILSRMNFSLSVVSDQPVRVDFFVMSKCPDARKCELLFIPTLFKLAPIVNFTISYIAFGNSPKDIHCLHGDEECQGNKQQLCVQNLSSQQTILKFLQCQSKDVDTIPSSAEGCFKESSDGSSKWSDIDACSKSEKGADLLYLSAEKSRLVSAKKSCTIHLNGRFWCMHDGSWYGCTEGRNEKSFIKAICARYIGPNKPSECSTIVA